MAGNRSQQNRILDWYTIVKETPMIVLVGEEKESFHVRPRVLRKSSGFFQAALKDCWTEGQERKLKPPDDFPGAFKGYSAWLYGGAVPHVAYVDLAILYEFGEKVIDPSFQDCIISQIVKTFQTPHNGVYSFPGGYIIDHVYQTTPPGSLGRRLMVDLWAVYGEPEFVHKIIDEGSDATDDEFLADLVKATLDMRNTGHCLQAIKSQIMSNAPCAYHIHDSDHPCEHGVVPTIVID